MKTKKYLVTGALTLVMSAPVMAQDADYAIALKPIIAAIEVAPNDPKATKDFIKEYQKNFEKSEEAIAVLGNVYLLQYNYDTATETANNTINNKKYRDSLAYVPLDDTVASKGSIGNTGAATTQYRNAITVDPQNVAAYECYAKVFRHVNSKAAIQKLEGLRKVKSDYPVETAAAEITLSDGKYREALERYAKANPTNTSEDNFCNCGFSTYITKDYQRALDVIKQGLQESPDSEYLSCIAMIVSVESRDYASAINYGKAVFTGPGKKVANDCDVYAKVLCGAQQYDEAINTVNKVLEIDKNNTESLKTLVAIRAVQGNDDRTLEVQQEHLSKSKRATNNNWVTLTNTYVTETEGLIDCAARSAVLARAFDVYRQMISKLPTIPDWVWLDQANIAQSMSDPDKAAEVYQKVAAYEETKPTLSEDSKSYLENVYYGLGYYYSRKGNKPLTGGCFNRVLKVDPNNDGAKKVLGM